MERIGYDRESALWKSLDSKFPDIELTCVKNDLYIFISDKQLIIRFFDGTKNENEPLGIVTDLKGNLVNSIPPFVHPDYKGLPKLYEICVGWAQSYREGVITFVVLCSNPYDFSIELNVDTMEYSKPIFVRA